MDYLSVYNKLIERGKSRKKVRGDGFHRHRIIPGCRGGKYIPENITFLHRKEHRIVHKLRYKLYQDPVDLKAYIKLNGKGRKGGWKNTEEHNRKNSLACMGRVPWNKNLSAATDKRIASYAKTLKKVNKERCFSAKDPLALAKKRREYNLGRHFYNNGKIEKRVYDSPGPDWIRGRLWINLPHNRALIKQEPSLPSQQPSSMP
jgi:hypothetical protein